MYTNIAEECDNFVNKFENKEFVIRIFINKELCLEDFKGNASFDFYSAVKNYANFKPELCSRTTNLEILNDLKIDHQINFGKNDSIEFVKSCIEKGVKLKENALKFWSAHNGSTEFYDNEKIIEYCLDNRHFECLDKFNFDGNKYKDKLKKLAFESNGWCLFEGMQDKRRLFNILKTYGFIKEDYYNIDFGRMLNNIGIKDCIDY